jgi:protein O-GlcNAc transferase
LPLLWKGLATIAPGDPDCDGGHLRRIRECYADIVRSEELPLLPRLSAEARASGSLSAGNRIRIGYVSAHWHQANYMKPVWPTLNAHHTERYDIVLFDDTKKLSEGTLADWGWLTNKNISHHSIANLNNRGAARLIQSLNIDVLVDLSAYSHPNRLGLFVHRPARIQSAWFNMYATSGFCEFDYLIGDGCVVLPEEERFYVEKIARLPISYLTVQTNHSAPEVAMRVAAQDNPTIQASEGKHNHAQAFHFGCLGTLYKITPKVLDAWSSILHGAPQSRLLVANRELRSICNRDYFVDQFSRRGVAPDRLSILPPATHFEFLRYYDQVDLALDTFPYNGGTTTMEAIWQGVPVLTFSGDRWAARTSQSLLAQTHLNGFVMSDVDQYIQWAIRYANDPAQRLELASLRKTMRSELSQSSVTRSEQLATELEKLFDAMIESL